MALLATGCFGSLAVVQYPIMRMAAFGRIADTQNESRPEVSFERLLLPIAVIQMAIGMKL